MRSLAQTRSVRPLSGDASKHRCPNCEMSDLELFYSIHQIPVHSTINLSSREDAINFPTGDLELGFCHRCGFISNTRQDSSLQKYSSQCEESQHISPTFNKFARELGQRWVDQYDLRNKTILEIGCGKGEFLALLCELGDNRGIGIDPSCQPKRTEFLAGSDRITFISDLYGEKYAHLQADCILCRHALEHIERTAEFVQMIRRVIGDRKEMLVLFELPDVTRILRESAFWDVYYEHCSYFSTGSLARLFRAAKFDLLDLERVYGDQYAIVAAKPVNAATAPVFALENDLSQTRDDVEHFRTTVNDSIAYWRNLISSAKARGEKIVLWSALSKAVSFLTTLNVPGAITYAVDINPHRQGRFLPKYAQQIVSPAFLTQYRPDHVILMNSIYMTEVKQELASMGLNPQVLALGGAAPDAFPAKLS